MEIFSIGYALLATQRALLDAITPELRAVVVDSCEKTNLLYIRFYYDGKASEKLIDLWQCAITEASADLGPDCLLDDGVERLDFPQKIPFRGRYAYLRKEPYFTKRQHSSHIPWNIIRETVDFKEKIGLFISPVSGEKVDTNWGVIHYAKDGRHTVPAKPKNYPIDIFPVAYALLAIQSAILGIVTPELRAIVVDLCKEENLCYVHFYYDGLISEELIDLWECAITKTFADVGQDYVLDAGIQRLDYPQKIPFRGRYAYFRNE
ncbi:MAG TPA: polymorphic toxin type 50 domain-containing protein [Rhabdochlamydiaceae bacterium]|nr:polymorphic toxin type 50 domain-containing protein [Rhabdochlamydiaceae bacterium]